MSDHFQTSYNADSPDLQGSVLGGILGGIVGMFVCIPIILLCCLFQISFAILFQLFTGLVIGWFYRLFHGQRSKPVAYVIVCICTVLTCILWPIAFALLSAGISSVSFTAEDWMGLWSIAWSLLLLCAGLGLTGFFFTRRNLLIYVDWKRAPWYIAYAGGNGALYNMLPEKLPSKNPPSSFAVHSRFAPGIHILVEGSNLRQARRFGKDRVFSAYDIAGVVLGPSSGCNVLYDKDYQVLAKFAGSMEHADLLLAWLLRRNIPIDKAPAGWHSPAETNPGSEPEISFAPQRQFTLRLKRSARIGFAGIAWFLLLLGLALFLIIGHSASTMTERGVIIILELTLMGMSIIYLRIGKICQVEIDGEQIHAVTRFGRATEFSVREVSSVSRNMDWIVLYDRQFKTLAKLDSYLEDLDRLKQYLAFYGIKM